MAVPTDITAGTITLTNGSTAFTGTGTGWLASDIREGDLIIWLEGGEDFSSPIIASIESNTAGTLEENWAGPTLSGVRYRIRYQWDSSRVSAQARQLIDQLGNGNIQSFASLTGPGVPVFDGLHSLVIRSEADFINGVVYDVQVDTLADRAAYDNQATGYSVLVSNYGDGRSAITSKRSNASGDWTDPAYVTGPLGPMPVFQINPTVTGAPGSNADVAVSPIDGGYELTFTIPEGRGFNPRGLYDNATAYLAYDLVYDGRGVQWRAKIDTTGNPPPALPTTSDANWEVFAGGRTLVPRGAYDSGETYVLDDLVTDIRGVSWRALITTTGNAPPILPTTSNTQWELFAGGRTLNPRGIYSGATAYAADDLVIDNGSSWRARIATTGNAPPALPATSNTQWELIAAKGLDGTGTGDVMGPASAVDERIAVFDGTTGKLIKDGGSGASISEINNRIDAKASVGLAIAMALVFGG